MSYVDPPSSFLDRQCLRSVACGDLAAEPSLLCVRAAQSEIEQLGECQLSFITPKLSYTAGRRTTGARLHTWMGERTDGPIVAVPFEARHNLRTPHCAKTVSKSAVVQLLLQQRLLNSEYDGRSKLHNGNSTRQEKMVAFQCHPHHQGRPQPALAILYDRVPVAKCPVSSSRSRQSCYIELTGSHSAFKTQGSCGAERRTDLHHIHSEGCSVIGGAVFALIFLPGAGRHNRFVLGKIFSCSCGLRGAHGFKRWVHDQARQLRRTPADDFG